MADLHRLLDDFTPALALDQPFAYRSSSRCTQNIRPDLPLLCKLDDVTEGRISPPCMTAFQRRRSFQIGVLRGRRIASSGMLARSYVVASLQAAVSAVQALPDVGDGSPATIAFHPDRPRFGLGTVGFTGGLRSALARALGSHLRAMICRPILLRAIWCHALHYSCLRCGQWIRCPERPRGPQVRSTCNLIQLPRTKPPSSLCSRDELIRRAM